MKEKIAELFKKIFAVGIVALGVVVTGIIAAWVVIMFVGGDFAVLVEAVIYNKIFPILYFIAILMGFVAIIYVYLKGIRTFRFETKTKN